MPMAGNGTRMNISIPKPMFLIKDKPMFVWVSEKIKVSKKIFIVKKEDIEKYNIDLEIKKEYPDAYIIVQNEKISGPLKTVMLAEDILNTDEDILILDCDMYTDIEYNKIFKDNYDAVIITFNSNEKNYSYVKKDNDNVINVIEKQVISNEAIAGGFYWKNGKSFLKYARLAIDNKKIINGEYYISSIYNFAVKDNIKIKTITAKTCYDLSTNNGIKNFTNRDETE
jgi:bifunctional N-acetylglucosamine-1-phosphate-uridyltransferase/glucosamine-1-phosphate-acetyltransferase GlmU-like protein